RRHTRFSRDWSSDVCSSDLPIALFTEWMKFSNALLPRLATIGIVVVPSLVSPLLASTRGSGSALSATNWIDYLDLSAGTVATGRSEERRVGKDWSRLCVPAV